jgi:hypothetical protein
VSFNKKIGKYRAEIRVNYKLHFLGNHATAELAARAYNRAARKLRHSPRSSSGGRLHGLAALKFQPYRPPRRHRWSGGIKQVDPARIALTGPVEPGRAAEPPLGLALPHRRSVSRSLKRQDLGWSGVETEIE